jgi:hypothetical protein
MSIVIHNDKLYSGGVVEPYVVIGTNRVSVVGPYWVQCCEQVNLFKRNILILF